MICSLRMGSSTLSQQTNHGIINEEDLDSISSSSIVSSESDLMEEEVNSSASSSPTSESSGSTSLPSSGQLSTDPLHDMSSLLQQLPFKRGLSKHFQGKSQSFTSLSSVRSLEDLAKPENPYNKRLKSCRSYAGLSESHRSRLISKKASRGSCASLLSAKRNASSFLGNRPPIHPPHRSTSTISLSNQTPLLA